MSGLNKALSSVAVKGLGWRFWVVLVAVAAGLRYLVAFVVFGDMPLAADPQDYSDLAASFLERFPPPEYFYWPPGNTMVLSLVYAVFGVDVAVTRGLLLALGVVAVVLVTLIAAEVTGAAAARYAGWLSAVYGPALMLSGQPYSHHLAACCILGIAYFGMRAAREHRPLFYLLTGVALGLGVLTRPSLLSVTPVLFVALVAVVAQRYRARDMAALRRVGVGAALFMVTVIGLVLPVMAHNHGVGAGWVVSTNNERNFFLGNNPYTPHYKTWHFASRPDVTTLEPEIRDYLVGYYQQDDKREAMKQAALEYIAGHPGITLYRSLNRIRAFWGFDYVASREIEKYYGWGMAALGVMLIVEAGGYIATMALVLVGMVCFWRQIHHRVWAWWLVALVLMYAFPYMLAFSNGFYHYAPMWLLIPFAGLALANLVGGGVATAVWRRAAANRWLWLAMGVLVFIQLEYAYQLFVFA